MEKMIILGPMAGLTNKAFRTICENFEPDAVVTEMVSSRGIYYKDSKTKLLLDTKGETKKTKVGVQIFGSEPEIMGYAAKYICENVECDFIDLNFGCPAPKIVKNGDGSRLLQTPEKIYDIVKCVKDNSSKKVTAKIRTGWDEQDINAIKVAKLIEKAGADGIAVHGRTRSKFYAGEADWNIIKQVKENVSIPVIGNGDIFSPEIAKKRIEETNVDGIMISRGSLGKPWIFKQIKDYLKYGKYSEISKEEKLKIMLEHIDLDAKEKGEEISVKEMRKHICYYLKGEPGASEIRDKINHLDSKDEVKQTLIDFYTKD